MLHANHLGKGVRSKVLRHRLPTGDCQRALEFGLAEARLIQERVEVVLNAGAVAHKWP